MSIRIAIVATLAALSGCVPWYSQISRSPPPPPDDIPSVEKAPDTQFTREQAFRVLLNARQFNAGISRRTGIDPYPREILAFQTIGRQPDASEAFWDLLRRATPEGQLYGLCGLYLTDRSGFEMVAQLFRDDQRKVFMRIGGHATDHLTLGEILESRSKNAIRLAPGQTEDQWQNVHPGEFVSDIVGGSIPKSLNDSHPDFAL